MKSWYDFDSDEDYYEYCRKQSGLQEEEEDPCPDEYFCRTVAEPDIDDMNGYTRLRNYEQS